MWFWLVGEYGYLSSITTLGVQVFLVTVDEIVNCVVAMQYWFAVMAF